MVGTSNKSVPEMAIDCFSVKLPKMGVSLTGETHIVMT